MNQTNITTNLLADNITTTIATISSELAQNLTQNVTQIGVELLNDSKNLSYYTVHHDFITHVSTKQSKFLLPISILTIFRIFGTNQKKPFQPRNPDHLPSGIRFTHRLLRLSGWILGEEIL